MLRVPQAKETQNASPAKHIPWTILSAPANEGICSIFSRSERCQLTAVIKAAGIHFSIFTANFMYPLYAHWRAMSSSGLDMQRKTEIPKDKSVLGKGRIVCHCFPPPHVLALTKRDSKAESLAPLASRGVFPSQRRSFVFFLEFEYIIVLSGMLMFPSACRFISYIKKRCTELWPRISFRRK